MKPTFSSHLVNHPFGDPGLYVEVKWARRALLFDLGENQSLGPTKLLKAGDIFVSHTHMDHFIGFDQVLRVALGRGKVVRLYGPPGLIANVRGKLTGYTWNLVDGYPLTIEVREFRERDVCTATFHASAAFTAAEPTVQQRPTEEGRASFIVMRDPMFTVRAVALDHRIPSFAYALEEQFHININRERLHADGLPVGSWLKDLKRHIWDRRPDAFRFTATLYFEHRREEREFRLGDVRDRFTTITRGQKIAYVVDARYDEENRARVVDLARGADVLYCEAPYLDRDADKARERYHLTARQAGVLARAAGARDLVVFHFSPRYAGQGELLEKEARAAFAGS